MLFQDLLRLHDIPEAEVALCLHKPADPVSRRAIAILAEDRPDLFEAYQASHANLQEATVRARRYFASFLAAVDGDMVFLGLYRREVGPILNRQDWLADPLRREMLERVEGHRYTPGEMADRLAGRTLFLLDRLDLFGDLEKRLICRDPGGRNYMRRAETTPLQVIELRRHGRVSPPIPDWRELSLTRDDLLALPRDWAAALRNWRGIYLIVDQSDGARYVGSAYGAANLLGRWQQHIAGETGVSARLAPRNTRNFRFSILERVSPDMEAEAVIALEMTWMDRLQTRVYGLNT